MNCVEIDMFLDHRFREMPGIRNFLTAEPNGLEIGIVNGQELFSGNNAQMVGEVGETGFCRRKRNLLLQNNVKQRRKPRRPCPKRGCAVVTVNKSHQFVRTSEFAAYRVQVLFADSFDFLHYANTIAAKPNMSIIPKLATSLNRRDEVPNQELAAETIAAKDATTVGELVQNLKNKNKGIRNDCIKVLYEIGYVEPAMIADHMNAFLHLLESKDNRLQWGAMTALGCIVKVKPDEIFAVLPKIITAADRGSVITRDHCVNILISLASERNYAREAFALLIKQLTTCPTNQLPMYAERAMPAVNATNRELFTQLLSSRLDAIEKESGRKRVEKVIKKLGIHP